MNIAIVGATGNVGRKIIEVLEKKNFNINQTSFYFEDYLETNKKNKIFKNSIMNIAGINVVHNYYGMVEQTGSIFMECEYGLMHCSNYSEIFIRNKDFLILEESKAGIVQIISLLPHSYPGHCLLSEDIGEIIGNTSSTLRFSVGFIY